MEDIKENDPSKKIKEAREKGQEIEVKNRGKSLSTVLGKREAIFTDEKTGILYLDKASGLPVGKKNEK